MMKLIKNLLGVFCLMISFMFAGDDRRTEAVTPVTALVVDPVVDPWVAVNPYRDNTYPKEDVSAFAQGTNYIATVGVMSAVAIGGAALAYKGGYFGYDGFAVAPVSLPFGSQNLSIPTTATLLAGGAYLLSFPTLNLPLGVATAWTTKKAAQGTEFVAKKGWKAVKWGIDTFVFGWDHFRATYMQGTLFANRHVTYEDTQKEG